MSIVTTIADEHHVYLRISRNVEDYINNINIFYSISKTIEMLARKDTGLQELKEKTLIELRFRKTSAL